MSRFEGLLKKNLEKKLAAIDRAQSDLNELVTDLNMVIRDEADGIAELKLRTVADDVDLKVFELLISAAPQSGPKRVIETFSLPGDGYPISTGTYSRSEESVKPRLLHKFFLDDREKLEI